MAILVFDLDGTLVFDGVQIAPELLPILKRLNTQHELIFASARPIRDMLPLLSDFPDNDLIGGNGSMVRQKGRIEVLARLDETSAQQIIKKIETENLDYVIDYDWDYTAKVTADHAIRQKLDTGHLAENVPCHFEKISKIITFDAPQKVADLFPTALYHADVQELVFTGENINKYSTLKTLIGERAYTAFGNDANDIELLDHAQLAFQIGQAPLPITCDKISREQLPQILQHFIK
jgi:HAD superfamily hydrolase (TIGR01484 family)